MPAIDHDPIRIPATSGHVGLDPALVEALAQDNSKAAAEQAMADYDDSQDDGLHVTPDLERAARQGDIEVHRAALRTLIPRRPVTLKAFAIDRDRVTNRQYAAFVKETGRPAPKHWPGGAVPAGRERHAVLYVSHEDASAYAAWAGLALPTEEEWEIAGGGADGRRYPWGDQPLSVMEELRRNEDFSVDAHPELASPSGMRGVFGSWEWCAGSFGPFPGGDAAAFAALFPTAQPSWCPLRGGFFYKLQWSLQSRVGNNPAKRNLPFGFRCVRR